MPFATHLALVRDQLDAAGAAVGGPVEEAAGRLAVLLEPALRLALQSALADAAADLSAQLAGTARVDVRLAAGEPVLLATIEPDLASTETPSDGGGAETPSFDGAVTRFTLRLPEGLKEHVDQAAAASGVSTNTWLVRAAERSLVADSETSRPSATSMPPARPGRSLSGWIA